MCGRRSSHARCPACRCSGGVGCRRGRVWRADTVGAGAAAGAPVAWRVRGTLRRTMVCGPAGRARPAGPQTIVRRSVPRTRQATGAPAAAPAPTVSARHTLPRLQPTPPLQRQAGHRAWLLRRPHKSQNRPLVSFYIFFVPEKHIWRILDPLFNQQRRGQATWYKGQNEC